VTVPFTLPVVSVPDGSGEYRALRRLGELDEQFERRRASDPYPRPAGPTPNLEALRVRREEINRVVASHGARNTRVFGSVARGDAGPDSDLDILIDMGDRRGLFAQAALQNELEDLLACRVHLTTTEGLTYAREDRRERIEREAVSL
jgi:predicted nucleotidyltransferase